MEEDMREELRQYRKKHKMKCYACSADYDCSGLRNALEGKMKYIESFKQDNTSVIVEQNKEIIRLLKKLVNER